MENINFKKENALEVFGTITLILGIIGFIVLLVCSFQKEGIYIHSTVFLPNIFACSLVSLISGIGTFLFFRVISEISKTLKTYNMEGIVKVSNNSDNNQNNSRNTVENDIHIIEGKDNYFSIGDTAIEISTGKRVIITNINKDGTYQCETENGENIGNLKQIELAQLN